MGFEITAPVIKLVSYFIWVTQGGVFKDRIRFVSCQFNKKVQEFFFYPKTNLIQETYYEFQLFSKVAPSSAGVLNGTPQNI